MFFSDVQRWSPLETAIMEYRPELILMGGDLTMDRFSSAHREAAFLVPKLWNRTRRVLEQRGLLGLLPRWFVKEIEGLEKGESNDGECAHALWRYLKWQKATYRLMINRRRWKKYMSRPLRTRLICG